MPTPDENYSHKMIIQYTSADAKRFPFNYVYPDQFVSEKEKQSPEYIKSTLDYFATVAYSQYADHKKTFVKNYNLLKGILTKEDFYEDPEVASFTETLVRNVDLPSYVKHYPIVNPPINTLVGEVIKRPDIHKVKAFDDESKSEQLQHFTDIYQDYVMGKVRESIMLEMAQKNGEEPDEEELNKMTLEKVDQYLTDYTSIAERWANRTLEALKMEFNMKELSEELFRDLLICARERFLVYEDTSKTGFNVKVVNPKNAWELTTPDKKYTKEAYAAGTVEIMEISQIINEIPELTKDEIDHMRKGIQDLNGIPARESNLGNPRAGTGIDTIKYDTYDPLVEYHRQLIESEMQGQGNKDPLGEMLGLRDSVSSYGYKFIVVRSYFLGKKLIKQVKFIDEKGNEDVLLTDDSYVDGSHPGEIEVSEGYINQWYEGIKIGTDVYHLKEFKLLDYCPLIGVTHEIKNTSEAKSLLDLLKPLQVLYNVCMNQPFKLLEKEVGVVGAVQIRRVPTPKDGDAQDAIDIWEAEARERGILFEDDSPENLKAPLGNTNTTRAIDLSRSNEMQTRYNLAVQLKNEAWELVGLSRQRMGNMTATETATATNTAITQSYAQTEPYFAQHEYVMADIYQAIIDAAQFIESHKPTSTISFISNLGESAFIQISGTEIRGRDLKIFVTSRPADQQAFTELRQLAGSMLQNGATAYEIVELYSTNSVRQMKQVFKKLKDQQDSMAQQQNQLEQQQMQQAQAQQQQMIQAQAQEKEADRINENYNKELDRINKKEVALISQLGRNPEATADVDNSGLSDALEITRMADDNAQAQKDHNIKLQQIQQKERERQDGLKMHRDQMQMERDKLKQQKEIELIKLRNPVAGEKIKKKPSKKK